jgi:hypothetical protein
MAPPESPNIEKTTFSRKVRRVFGLDLHSWEQLMLLSLGVAGLIAIAVFLTTASVVILQRHETADAKNELDEYKLTVEAKVADAKKEGIEAGKTAGNALVRAEELKAANLALEARIAPRRLELSQQQKIADALVKFSGRHVAVASYAQDAESAILGQQFIEILAAAHLPFSDETSTISSIGRFALGIHVRGPDEELAGAIRKAIGNFSGLLVATKEQTADPISQGGSMLVNPDAPEALASIVIGIKPITK